MLTIVQPIEIFSLCGSFFFSCLLQDWKLEYDEGKFTWRQAKEEQRNMASMVMERPTGAGNAKEKVKKQLIYDHLVRRQMEDGLGSFWRSVLWVINEVEGCRGTWHKAKATEASGESNSATALQLGLFSSRIKSKFINAAILEELLLLLPSQQYQKQNKQDKKIISLLVLERKYSLQTSLFYTECEKNDCKINNLFPISSVFHWT